MFRRPSPRQVAAALGGGLGMVFGKLTVPPEWPLAWQAGYFVFSTFVVMVICGLGAEGRSRAGPAITEGNLIKKVSSV